MNILKSIYILPICIISLACSAQYLPTGEEPATQEWIGVCTGSNNYLYLSLYADEGFTMSDDQGRFGVEGKFTEQVDPMLLRLRSDTGAPVMTCQPAIGRTARIKGRIVGRYIQCRIKPNSLIHYFRDCPEAKFTAIYTWERSR
jgi:hypothetical protein